MLLKIAFLTWMAGAGLDNATSYDFTSHYTPNIYQRQDGTWFRITEGNPLFAPLKNHPAAMSASMAGYDALTYWMLHKWVEPRHGKAAIGMYFALAGERFALAALNLRAMHNADMSVRSQPYQITTSVHPTNGITLYARIW